MFLALVKYQVENPAVSSRFLNLLISFHPGGYSTEVVQILPPTNEMKKKLYHI